MLPSSTVRLALSCSATSGVERETDRSSVETLLGAAEEDDWSSGGDDCGWNRKRLFQDFVRVEAGISSQAAADVD